MRVRAVDLQGQPFERELIGLLAVCFEHELDHLRGTLFVDRLPFFKRLRARRQLQRGRAHRFLPRDPDTNGSGDSKGEPA